MDVVVSTVVEMLWMWWCLQTANSVLRVLRHQSDTRTSADVYTDRLLQSGLVDHYATLLAHITTTSPGADADFSVDTDATDCGAVVLLRQQLMHALDLMPSTCRQHVFTATQHPGAGQLLATRLSACTRLSYTI